MTPRFAAVALLVLGLGSACAWWGDGGQAIVYRKSDNACTLSPDVAGGACCSVHDLAYGLAGTDDERLGADAALLACLIYEGVPSEVALTYYYAVRHFGASHWRSP